MSNLSSRIRALEKVRQLPPTLVFIEMNEDEDKEQKIAEYIADHGMTRAEFEEAIIKFFWVWPTAKTMGDLEVRQKLARST